jgi:ribonuclease G
LKKQVLVSVDRAETRVALLEANGTATASRTSSGGRAAAAASRKAAAGKAAAGKRGAPASG